jgi:hypothetical protein
VSAKLLLLRTGSSVFHSKALIATTGGLYDRPLENDAELMTTLQEEKFDLIICDARHKESGNGGAHPGKSAGRACRFVI